MNVVLDASVQREADPEGYMPTASTMVALSLGHALAVGSCKPAASPPSTFAAFIRRANWATTCACA